VARGTPPKGIVQRAISASVMAAGNASHRHGAARGTAMAAMPKYRAKNEAATG
jgi:hypothetical protein